MSAGAALRELGAPTQALLEVDAKACLEYAREVVRHEAAALLALVDRLDVPFVRTVEAILRTKGRVVLTGMGKPGLIGQKVSATLASTGTPSFVLHPAEAFHGDLGRILADDVVIVLSNSGETEEIVRLMPHLRRAGPLLVAVTGRPESTLGQLSDIVLDIGRLDEACPLGMAPSTSTTAMLAVGDALALAVQKERRLTKEEYARFHPGGSLGRKLLRVEEIMRTGPQSPVVDENTTVKETLAAITRARAGAVSVADVAGKLVGIFTDGDLRRLLGQGAAIDGKIGAVMTRSPRTIGPQRLASEAARLMQSFKIDELPVVDEAGTPIGMVDVQDLLAVGLA